jgi:ABC-2 type transport system ATP-binding protein
MSDWHAVPMTISEQAQVPTTKPLAGGIVLAGLHKSYGEVHAVRGVDLAIAPGETVALLGPNGAGKSTTIDMMLGLTTPNAGTVSIFGTSPRQAVAKGAIGAMLQTGGLIRDLDVRELLQMMASLYPSPLDVDDLLESSGIGDLARRRTQSLSGGQTQRVRAAMALVSDPDLLVLDEPTVAMDVEARHAFWSAMREFAATGRTVIFATHYLEEADLYADRIVLMSEGLIVADGPANEIKATVGRRTIRATLPGADLSSLGRLPGVESVDRRGVAVVLDCTDSDTAIRGLLQLFPEAKDIEITAAGLEAAFLSLTKTKSKGATA